MLDFALGFICASFFIFVANYMSKNRETSVESGSQGSESKPSYKPSSVKQLFTGRPDNEKALRYSSLQHKMSVYDQATKGARYNEREL